jgi:hypothetical protein
MKRRHVALLGALVLAVFIWTGPIQAGQVTGTVQGLTCVTMGKVCPLDQEDPVIAAEDIFVVYTDTGEHYFVPNLDRAVMARHIRETVRVTGEMQDKYNAIKAEKLEVKENGAWKTAWSQSLQQKWEKELRQLPY